MGTLEIIEPRLFDGVVADEIVALVQDFIADHGYCSLVLCGGSTPAAIYRCLARPPRVNELPWRKIRLYWGDERWVPHDHDQSNFRMVQETLLSHPGAKESTIVAVDTTLKDCALGAQEFARSVQHHEKLVNGALPVFDLVLLGMGEDGHFASVFPGSPLLKSESPNIAAAVKKPSDGTERVSMVPSVLFNARRVMFIVRGESKAEMVKRVMTQPAHIEELPASIHHQYQSKVSWFLDSGAGKLLEKP